MLGLSAVYDRALPSRRLINLNLYGTVSRYHKSSIVWGSTRQYRKDLR